MKREILILPAKKWWRIDLFEIWEFRELFVTLAWRDVLVRYKQTVLGIAWVVFQPLVTTGIFSIFFGKIAKIPSDGMPYPLFIIVGIAYWNFFAGGVVAASNSLINNSNIITKVYFPRLIVPLSSIVTSAVDFGVTVAVIVLALIYFHQLPSFQFVVIFPMLIIILLFLMSGLGLLFAALNVRFRDVRFILPFFVQIGLYLTPIIYPLSVIYDFRKFLLILNPLTAVVEISRSLIMNRRVDWNLFEIATVISIGIFFIGLWAFRQAENLFVDIS